MRPFLVLYATREGYTRHVADRVVARIVERGYAAEAKDVGTLKATFDVDRYRAAIVTASVHGGRYETEMVAFVRLHRGALERISSAFLSVSLDEAHVTIAGFLRATGWRPRRVEPVAGALLYSRHGAVSRFVMMLRARHRGVSTDTSRDHEYTDWVALDRFVDELVDQLDDGPSSATNGPNCLG